MPPLLLTNFEIQKNFQNVTKFNGVYSRNNLPKTAYAINLDEFKSLELHWIALYMNAENVTYFTAQKMKFFIKDFFSKCNQIGIFMRIWSRLLKKSLMKNFICFAVL